MDQKTDFVIPFVLNAEYSYSRANTGFEHLEIEYVIRSIRKFCPFAGRIFIVGPHIINSWPKSIAGEITYLRVPDKYTHIKDANLINAVLSVINSVPDLSETFIMASDDQIVTRECSLKDFYPRVKYDMTGHLKEYKAMMDTYSEKDGSRKWNEAMLKTLMKFPDRPYFYEPHIWTPFDKAKFVDMCREYDIAHDDGVVIFTLYNNYTKQTLRADSEHTYLHAGLDDRALAMALKSPTRHIAWTDKTFNNKLFREFLGNLLDLR